MLLIALSGDFEFNDVKIRKADIFRLNENVVKKHKQ